MKQDFWVTTEDEIELYVQCWGKEIIHPKAILFISHGMTEHIGRYGSLATYFTKKDMIVYGNDHRGHGRTGEKQGQLGFIADENGFDLLVEDLHFLIQYVKNEHPGVPVFIYGHSMGSFVTRNYLQKYADEITGVILSGSGSFPDKSTKTGLGIASLQEPRKESAFMNQLVFGNYNNKIVERLTSFDWLTRDKELVEEYVNDRLSGYVPTAGFFVDLLTGIINMQDENKNRNINKNIPLLFISGDEDPVGKYGKGVFEAANNYVEVGLTNVLVALYPEARHELHNEINKTEVFHFIDNWITEQLKDNR
jgi:alpha-beta hydrolase superfamily lysophospholipase